MRINEENESVIVILLLSIIFCILCLIHTGLFMAAIVFSMGFIGSIFAILNDLRKEE